MNDILIEVGLISVTKATYEYCDSTIKTQVNTEETDKDKNRREAKRCR